VQVALSRHVRQRRASRVENDRTTASFLRPVQHRVIRELRRLRLRRPGTAAGRDAPGAGQRPRLILQPVRHADDATARAACDRVATRHRKSLKKLAE